MMDNHNSQSIRISLPPGTKLLGERDSYIVKQFVCMSSRSVTVLCESSNGNVYRLKLYNGQHSIHQNLLRKIMGSGTKGVVQPVDLGVYGSEPFAVYPIVKGTDTSKLPIPRGFLIQNVIPQLVQVIHQYHQKRILLRDICPEHILCKAQEQQITYCGFSNFAVLADRSTITKACGYGQHPSFIAPEVPKYGYSTCADYYALGVTILTMILGRNPMQQMTWNDIQKNLWNARVPGIDIDYLRNTPYDLYSETDKVLYLVLGLMLPNPRLRWGYGELQCWCNGQHIPLTRKEGRIFYQYNEPFLVGNYKCWNYQQLAQTIAAEPHAWTDATFSRLEQFAKRQTISGWNQMDDLGNSSQLTTNGRIFRAIYSINPALNGFWWVGEKFENSTELIQKAARSEAAAIALEEILKNHVLSFFLRMRKRIASVSDADISEIEQIEQWEISEKGKGVNRCILRFSDSVNSRFFRFKGKDYENMAQLLSAYSSNILHLKRLSAEVLTSDSFQAWLWSIGMESTGRSAQKLSADDPQQAFYLLLKIAESTGKTDSAKQDARKMYLQYGEYGPIYWLCRNINDYRMVSIGDQILFDAFRNADLSLNHSIETLSSSVNQLVTDYQHFVLRTAKSATEVKGADLDFCCFSFYPVKDDYFFCCRWENDLEVTPAFLRSIGDHA